MAIKIPLYDLKLMVMCSEFMQNHMAHIFKEIKNNLQILASWIWICAIIISHRKYWKVCIYTNNPHLLQELEDNIKQESAIIST
jgi:hypothetical protein